MITQMQSPLRGVDQVLRFSETNTFLDVIKKSFAKHITSRFEDAMTWLQEIDQNRYEHILGKKAQLDNVEFQRFLLYPKVSNVLNLVRQDIVLQVSDLLIRRLDAEVAVKYGTFDTDQYHKLYNATNSCFVYRDDVTGKFVTQNLLQISGAVSMDFISADFKQPNVTLTSVTPEQAVTAHSRIQESLNPLKNLLPFDFIESLEDVIHVRQLDENEKLSFISCTSNMLCRQINLMAKDFATLSNEQLADAIIHEAIHSLLDQLDYVTLWSPIFPESEEHTIISPWTGNRINMDGGYTQAIFVWYGLYNLWSNTAVRAGYQEAYADKRLTMIRKGFQNFEPEQSFASVNIDISEDLLSVYRDMKNHVLSN